MHDSSTNTVSRLKGSYNLFSPCRTSYNRTLFQVLFPDKLIQIQPSVLEIDFDETHPERCLDLWSTL